MTILEKALDQINEVDLQNLVATPLPEGVQLDYKREFPSDNKKFAKVIASFANTHGGLLIVGMEEDKSTGNLTLLGINPNPANTEKVDQIVFEHVHPSPQYLTREVKLASNNQRVVLVKVEESEYPPHFVHGVIPVRSGETTNWVKDLRHYHEIEKLYEKRLSRSSFTSKNDCACDLVKKDVYDKLGAGNFPFWMLSTVGFPVRGQIGYPIFSPDLKAYLENIGGGEFSYHSVPHPFVQYEKTITQTPTNLAYDEGIPHIIGRERTRVFERYSLLHLLDASKATDRGTDNSGGFRERTLEMFEVKATFKKHLNQILNLLRKIGYRSDIAIISMLTIAEHTVDFRLTSGQVDSTRIQTPDGPIRWRDFLSAGHQHQAEASRLTDEFCLRLRRLLGEYVLDAKKP